MPRQTVRVAIDTARKVELGTVATEAEQQCLGEPESSPRHAA